MENREKKAPKLSEIQMRELVMPHHSNALGTAFGGTVMSWIDIAAAMCAAKHCGRDVVTAHVDDIDFLKPIQIGEHVIIKSSMNYAGRTSMVVGVSVMSENPYTGERQKTTKAYLTFVALDKNKKPIIVPELAPETEKEKRRFHNAEERRIAKRELLKRLKSDS